MTDLDRLLAVIIANPDDNDLRMVYADKIQDRDRPGDAERAEFIRVQVQGIPGNQCEKCSGTGKHKRGYCDAFMYGCDEFGDDDCSHNNELINCGECASLRKRERELFNANCDKWFPVPPGYGFDWAISLCPDDNDARPSYIVRRGFIAEVRAPLASLVGGDVCSRCNGNKLVWAAWEVKHEGAIYPGRKRITCPACHGTGRTPVVLPAIAKSHPLEWVGVTDAIHEDGRFPGGHRIDREQFPRELWLSLILRAALSFKGIVPPHANAITGTREELEELLSRALITWARKEQPCTT